MNDSFRGLGSVFLPDFRLPPPPTLKPQMLLSLNTAGPEHGAPKHY